MKVLENYTKSVSKVQPQPAHAYRFGIGPSDTRDETGIPGAVPEFPQDLTARVGIGEDREGSLARRDRGV